MHATALFEEHVLAQGCGTTEQQNSEARPYSRFTYDGDFTTGAFNEAFHQRKAYTPSFGLRG